MKQNYSLKNHNTFGVEVYADYFSEVKNENELREALTFVSEQDIPFLVLGGGSNILLTQDVKGLVVQLNLKGITEKLIDENTIEITAQAGENWHEFVTYCVDKNYGGLENLSLIPGNVGTCPIQNIGAYGKEIKDHFYQSKVLNLETLEVEIFDKAKCNFGYRDSIFKRQGKGKYIILEVSFHLTLKNHELKTEYGAIRSELEQKNISSPTIKEVAEAVISIRESKLPNPKVIGNAGSFFKNPVITENQFVELEKQYPKIPHYANPNGVKVPAGWLIEQCGWKGKQIGNVATHEKQALVIINKTGKATGKEIFDFSTQIITSVKEKFGIALEREVNIL
ncbi:MAG: UDP-N-acetylenolpyruvoylglucosamine reductase [Flavobacteriales bacterium]|nr:MAG: UDP-N-acetylenolpyruvoylglucosamine reductase [Flavobacteriales bacterium]